MQSARFTFRSAAIERSLLSIPFEIGAGELGFGGVWILPE
jgi:hypothetical protein